MGRNSRSDITINQENISRNHLVISHDGMDFFIEDISLSNHIMLDGEKIPKNQKIRVFEFSKITLANNFVKLQISADTGEDNTGSFVTLNQVVSADSKGMNTRTNTKLLSEMATKSNKKRTAKKPARKTSAKPSLGQRYLILGIIFITVLTWAYNEYFIQDEILVVNQPRNRSKKPKTKRPKFVSKESPIPRSPFVSYDYREGDPITQVSDLKKLDICKDELFDICKPDLFPNKSKADAIIKNEEGFMIYKDFVHNARMLFYYKPDAYLSQLNNPDLIKVVAAHNVLEPSNLIKLEEKGINQFKIIVYYRYSNAIEPMATFKVFTDTHKKVQANAHQSAYKFFLENLSYDMFETRIGKWLELEGELISVDQAKARFK